MTLSRRTLTECISNECREKFLTSALSLFLSRRLAATRLGENDETTRFESVTTLSRNIPTRLLKSAAYYAPPRSGRGQSQEERNDVEDDTK